MKDLHAEHQEREHFFGAAKVVTALTIGSRILGMLRDIAMLSLGAPKLADAFWAAFAIPNLFRRLFGEGALSAAFVPVFTDVAERKGWDRARGVLANVAGWLGAVLAALVVLVEIGLLVGTTYWPGDVFRMRIYQFAAIMTPYMFTVCLLALGAGALNCRGRFAAPAAMPIVLNVGLIATAWYIAPALANSDDGQFFVLSIALVITGVVQLVAVIWLLKAAGLLALPHLQPICDATRLVARRMMPMLIPLSVLQVSAFADRLIGLIFAGPGQPLDHGVVRSMYAASRFYQFPLGVLAISIATVVFPLFSRYASRGDTDGFRDAVNRALRLCLFLGIPAGAGLCLLGEPILRAILVRRNFGESDVLLAARMLEMYGLGMVAYFCNHILLRAFFARNETRTPLLISSVLAGVNILMVLGGIFTPLGARTFGLATAITQTLTAAGLVIVLRIRLGGLGGRLLLASTIRITVATAVMAAVIYLVVGQVHGLTSQASAVWSARAQACAAVLAGAIAYAAAAWLVRCPELKELLRRTTPDKA